MTSKRPSDQDPEDRIDDGMNPSRPDGSDLSPGDAERAALFALDALDAAERAAVEEALDDDRALERSIDGFRAVTDALLESEPAAEPSESLRNRFLKGVADGSMTSGDQLRAVGYPSSPPCARVADAVWKPMPWPGISIRVLDRDPETGRVVFVLRCEPGAIIPRHRHVGSECFYVMRGDMRNLEDPSMPPMRAGDFQFNPSRSYHAEFQTTEGCDLFVVAHSAEYLD